MVVSQNQNFGILNVPGALVTTPKHCQKPLRDVLLPYTKLEKFPILTQNHELNPFENYNPKSARHGGTSCYSITSPNTISCFIFTKHHKKTKFHILSQTYTLITLDEKVATIKK